MAIAEFKFFSGADGGDQFTVVGFSGFEAISRLYRYELEIKAPISAKIDLDEALDNPARFVTLLDEDEYPVHGVLSSIDELRTDPDYVHYRAVLVPRLWWLSIYRTNEIYTTEKTVDAIIQLVLENAGLADGADFDLGGLVTDNLLQRNYRCQFGESDFDFLSRLMENEGIFYYFDHSGAAEKIIFINDLSYQPIARPDLIFEVSAQAAGQYDSINAWSCRKQRLPAEITVRDYNPEQPSLDIANTMPVDQMGQGTEYLYGENIENENEAAYLTTIRAEEHLCNKTRYYGEGSAAKLHAGFTFNLGGHPNEKYNGLDYLAIEVNHRGEHLDMQMASGAAGKSKTQPQYRNDFVAMEASVQFRPAKVTPKPRFFGTMNAFVFSEVGGMKAEIDLEGRYRVHLPFDRADGTKESSDPNRKASTWIRMAQPYVGKNEGMYYPLEGGTEVLLTFINGDPDQPVISGALPNASEPSLVTSDMNLQRTITSQVSQTVTGSTHRISRNSRRLALMEEQPPAPDPVVVECEFINENANQVSVASSPPDPSMIPPWDGLAAGPLTLDSRAYDELLVKFKEYDENFVGHVMVDQENESTDRDGNDVYSYNNRRTFAYPQHERVYFIGTFHEDFHLKDDFLDSNLSWTGVSEQFNFPEPGGVFPSGTNAVANTDAEVNPSGIRGVSEDKRWGDQMFYAYGRSFNWAGGTHLNHQSVVDFERARMEAQKQALEAEKDRLEQQQPYLLREQRNEFLDQQIEALDQQIAALVVDPSKDGCSFGTYSYGNGYTENLQIAEGGTSDDLTDGQKEHHDDYLGYSQFADNLGSTSVEKTFGPTYSYQNGFSLDVKVGDSHSKVYGNSDSMVDGNSKSKTTGWTLGIFHGNKRELLMGADTELKLAADTEVKLAGDFTFHAGISTELLLALKAEVMLGFDIGFQAAGFLKYTTGFGIDVTNGAMIRDETAAVRSEKASVKKMLADIRKGEISCEANQLKINKAILHMFA